MQWSPTEWYRDGREYLSEVRAEVRKVTWPSQKEFVGGTISVLVVVAVVTTVLGIVDFALSRGVQWILP